MSGSVAPANLRSRSAAWLPALPMGIALLAALLHGIIYLLVIPPWQHYDEPNHFEIVWWVAAHGRFPVQGDSDPAFNTRVVESMVENDFYAHMGFLPDLSQPVQRMPGISQVDEPPLYYYLAAIPVMLLSSASVETQLYGARVVSLLLFLLTVLAGWGIACELFPAGHFLRWLLPLSVALLPALVDIMTAVNNDAAAIAVGSLFIWGGLRLVRRGLSALDLSWMIAAAVLAYFTKSTAYIALLALPLIILFAVLRGKWRKLAWVVLLVVFLAGTLAALRWGDAAYWHRTTRQAAATRQLSDKAVIGKSVLVLSGRYPNPQNWLAELSQPLPEQEAAQIRGQMVTLGVWMWASQPVQANLPWIMSNFPPLKHVVQLGTEPVFFAYQLELPPDADRIWIALQPALVREQNVTFYYDGFVLVTGARPLVEIPRFTTTDGSRGEWGGTPFQNLIRNPSLENAGPRVQPRLDKFAARFLGDDTLPSMLVSALLDWQATGFYYRLSANLLLQRFWAVFAWAHVTLQNPGVYDWLSAITLAGLAGVLLAILRRRQRLPWDAVFILALMVTATWGMALLRGTPFIFHTKLYYTVARHAYPVVVPTMLALLLGWREILLLLVLGLQSLAQRIAALQPAVAFAQSSLFRQVSLGAFVLMLLALDGYAIWSIVAYYAA